MVLRSSLGNEHEVPPLPRPVAAVRVEDRSFAAGAEPGVRDVGDAAGAEDGGGEGDEIDVRLLPGGVEKALVELESHFFPDLETATANGGAEVGARGRRI